MRADEMRVGSLTEGNMFLGAGGRTPRVDILGDDAAQVETLLELPEGHSAYAIDVSPDGTSIAVGTKEGDLYIVSFADDSDRAQDQYVAKLIQGAPILSACFVDNTQVAVSDVAGRCLLWNIHQNEPLRVLVVEEGVVCTLLGLDHESLVGLSSQGELTFWNFPDTEVTHTVKGVAPPGKSALVNMLHWPGENSLVFPGKGGILVLFELDTEKHQKIAAHEGDFYSLGLLDDHLMTIGMKDGRLKLWEAGSMKEPVIELRAPKGIISAALIDPLQKMIILVNDRGEASIYQIEKNKMNLKNKLAGGDYRIAWGFPFEELKALHIRQREEQAIRISEEIKEKINNNDTECIEELHSQLVDIGYEHISLELRAEQAGCEEDIVTEMKFRGELVQILPSGNPAVCRSFEQYASLLEHTWQLEEAHEMYRKIHEIDPRHRVAERLEELKRYIKAMQGEKWVLEADTPIRHIIEAADVLGKPFIGRYLLKAFKPWPCKRISINEIVKKYAAGCADHSNLPPANVERLLWLTRRNVEKVRIITFGNGAGEPVKGLQFGLKLRSDDAGTIAIFMALFDARNIKPNAPVESHNREVQEALEKIIEDPLVKSWLKKMFRAVNNTLGRLNNEHIADEEGARK